MDKGLRKQVTAYLKREEQAIQVFKETGTKQYLCPGD